MNTSVERNTMIGDKMIRSFVQTYDLNTEQGAPTLLGIHTPIGGDAWRFLGMWFRGFTKYKYLGCDITIVNAARLPVDPEQLGKIEGENYIDPRDTLNPVMFKGCHGESLGEVINSMYGGLTSDIFKGTTLDKIECNALLENFYYTALGDDAWRKSPVQKTLRIRGLKPMCYSLATTHQIAPNNNILSEQYADNTYPEVASNSQSAPDYPQSGAFQIANQGTSGALSSTVYKTGVYDAHNNAFVNKQVGSLFTNKLVRLGWRDTMQFLGNNTKSMVFESGKITELPKLFMGILMLPPAYLTRQYLRVIITHRFAFKGIRTVTTGGNTVDFATSQKLGYAYEITGNIPSGNVANNPDKGLSAPLGGEGGEVRSTSLDSDDVPITYGEVFDDDEVGSSE